MIILNKGGWQGKSSKTWKGLINWCALKPTGTLKELASKLGVSESTLYEAFS